MKLFNPSNKNGFVLAYVPKAAREGTSPTYGCIQAGSIEEAEKSLEQKAFRAVYPYVLGRYDEKGRYMTYKPPIDGVTPGRFVLHPLAQEEMNKSGWH